MAFSLTDPIGTLRLVSPKSQAALQHLGIVAVADLLRYYPADWKDLSQIDTIDHLRPGESINLRAKIKKLSQHWTRWRRMTITEALLADETGDVVAIWFNQPFLKNVLKEGHEYYFSGKGQLYADKKTKTIGRLQLANPTFELVKEETIHTAGIVPIYSLTEGLTQKQLRYWLNQALPAAAQIQDYLPKPIRDHLDLPILGQAIRAIHFPTDPEVLNTARRRLAFDELFLFQLALQSFRRTLKALPAPPIPFDVALIKKFVAELPFQLTNSQRLAAWEILQDMEHPHPMNRLLEGEVGSGKTVVAGLAMLAVAQANYQSVLLAPTEILALQHYQTLQSLLNSAGLAIALQTRNHKHGDLAEIASGKTRIIVGTHALLQEKIRFPQIGLLIVDEQHRFGVRQRSQLLGTSGQNLMPHLLSMSATPIPRTLALAFYGDLDISQLKELPRGRKKIVTRLVDPQKRGVAYEFIRKEIGKGRQAYVVTPLIEESDKLGVKSVTLEAKKLQTAIFPELTIEVLHGRLAGDKKKNIMDKFKNNEIQILVTTTVIEVGVDVPNATIMIIENAERFGLAQLHQLRGRVGRSNYQSFCLLFSESPTAATKARLAAVVNSTDGFALAEKDLELRGPGETIGTQQSGFIPFKIAKLSDKQLIKLAKTEAEKLLVEDPNLADNPLLKQKVQSIARDAHLE